MRLEITETTFNQLTNFTTPTIYRYDCFIDDVYMTSETCSEKQDLYKIYHNFIKKLLKDWNTLYKKEYGMNKITKHDMGWLNPVTIIKEDIQDINLTLKQANEFIRLQKMEGDFT